MITVDNKVMIRIDRSLIGKSWNRYAWRPLRRSNSLATESKRRAIAVGMPLLHRPSLRAGRALHLFEPVCVGDTIVWQHLS